MLKRLLLALDDTPSSRAARDFAIDLAARRKAELTGIGVVDLPHITAGEAVPLGGMAYKEALDQHEIAEAQRRRERLKQDFASLCSVKNVPHEALASDGDPLAALLSAIATHDLLVMGHDAAFHGEKSKGTVETTRRLLEAHPRPMAILPDALPAGGGIVALYDASLPAMRALQMFALLGLTEPGRIEVLSVGEDEAGARQLTAQAGVYLSAHGFQPEPRIVVSSRSAPDVIAAELKALAPSLIVMGAFGHSGLTSLFFGSTTRRLLSEVPAPLFIFA